MDEREARAALIKQNRRSLIDALKLVYPLALTFYSLRQVLAGVEEHYLKGDITYLVEKGYVAWVNRKPNMNWPSREYKLTAVGVEIADAINTDPALEP